MALIVVEAASVEAEEAADSIVVAEVGMAVEATAVTEALDIRMACLLILHRWDHVQVVVTSVVVTSVAATSVAARVEEAGVKAKAAWVTSEVTSAAMAL